MEISLKALVSSNPRVKIYFDMGYFFSVVRRGCLKGNMHALAASIGKFLEAVKSIELVFDGPGSTAEKQPTATIRQAQGEKKLVQFRELCEPWVAAPEKRVRASLWKRAMKYKEACSRPTVAQISELAALLRSNGHIVHVAPGEADIFIANRTGPQDIVIGNDSDYLGHQTVCRWAIPFKRKGSLLGRLYKRDAIVKKLGLTDELMTVLCIVSGNDYSSNIRGYGMAKNCKLLQVYQPIS
jgi:hypothetical protein